MTIKIINKQSLKAQAEERIRKGFLPLHSEMVNIVQPTMKMKGSQEEKFNLAEKAIESGTPGLVISERVLKYGSALDIPQPCVTRGGKMMSAREMIKDKVFASSNTIPTDWQTLWDALRIDISIRKAAQGAVRESFYNLVNMPNSSKTFNVTEFYPYGVVFEENNGEGQAITQGETRGGQTEAIEHLVYAAGFTWTLLAELFAGSLDMTRIADSVALGYDAKRDDLSLSPIIDFSYSGVQKTPADATSSAERQELLYNTLEDGVDDLGERDDPITGRQIVAQDLRILASPLDARHIARVINGFTTPAVGGQNHPKNLPAISEISQVVSYDGETIPLRAKDVTYSGVTNGTCYMVKKNRYMNVGIKRGLILEVDQRPDVKTLSREERAWYFVEGQQTTGIQWFVQEITLPTW